VRVSKSSHTSFSCPMQSVHIMLMCNKECGAIHALKKSSFKIATLRFHRWQICRWCHPVLTVKICGLIGVDSDFAILVRKGIGAELRMYDW
jgi:hypothetical protein